MALTLVMALLASAALVQGLHWENLDMEKNVLVYLFEWKWADVAKECEDFLRPRGFAGVIVSPPNENLVLPGRPAHERYQSVSYNLVTRSGNEAELKDMLRRCNKAGIKVIADAVLNNMAGNIEGDCVGTDGSPCDSKEFRFPAVPFTEEDFYTSQHHAEDEPKTPESVRTGEVNGLHSLKQSRDNVRKAQIEFLNKLLAIGFAGFRLDAARHMYPEDLKYILDQLHLLNPQFGLPHHTKPFIYSEVIDMGGEVISYSEYTDFGLVTDYRYGFKLSMRLIPNRQKKIALGELINFGSPSDKVKDDDPELLPKDQSLMFVDNVDLQLNKEMFYYHASPTKKQIHKMAVAFMLSYPWATPMIMSSYRFDSNEDGPPHDDKNNILSPNPDDNKCQDRWTCEHRWPQIYNMVHFYNVVKGSEVKYSWTNGNQQVAFCRENKGFIAFNLERKDNLDKEIQTCMPPGVYCDVISGSSVEGKCTGKTVTVDNEGVAKIVLPPQSKTSDGILAIHIESCESGCVNKAESVVRWKNMPKVKEGFGFSWKKVPLVCAAIGGVILFAVVIF